MRITDIDFVFLSKSKAVTAPNGRARPNTRTTSLRPTSTLCAKPNTCNDFTVNQTNEQGTDARVAHIKKRMRLDVECDSSEACRFDMLSQASCTCKELYKNPLRRVFALIQRL
eukprot:TRINITY_DN76857_c0_g1_i1.p2 TRINITY_DN76857_c0_g1~~TRINITY_DN76857_c0_g1_i1.p2  ORF type:complete len:113 (-),score=1.87 TRINITY_DN76857_c0_g1_i1:9-347(-)